MSAQTQNPGWGLIVLLVVGFALFLQALTGNSSSSNSSSNYTPPRDNSFERRYVEERFKQEGYSSTESAQAADAILKFQRAQEAQRNR